MNRNTSKTPFIKSKQFFKKLSIITRKFRTLCRILFKEEYANTRKSLILKGMIKPLMIANCGKKIRETLPMFRPWMRFLQFRQDLQFNWIVKHIV